MQPNKNINKNKKAPHFQSQIKSATDSHICLLRHSPFLVYNKYLRISNSWIGLQSNPIVTKLTIRFDVKF